MLDPDEDRRPAVERRFEEPDPEADLPDPERELPSVPEAPSVPPESAAPPALLRDFWAAVLIFNVALAGVSVGLMALAFTDDWRLGWGLLAAGVAAALFGLRRYRNLRDRDR